VCRQKMPCVPVVHGCWTGHVCVREDRQEFVHRRDDSGSCEMVGMSGGRGSCVAQPIRVDTCSWCKVSRVDKEIQECRQRGVCRLGRHLASTKSSHRILVSI
jgi:hypothetical protein